MGYEYDSKVNRDLARTAMSIYTKSHGIKSLNESTQSINEEVLRENINSLILNYVSDVIVLAEQELGREMTDVEINEASIELLNRINSISDEDKTNFVTQLAEEAAPGMVAAPTVTAGGGAGPAPAPSRPVDGGAISNFDPSNYDATDQDSIEQLFRDVASGMYGEGAVAGSLLSQVIANQQSSSGIGTSTRGAAQRPGAARRRLGEAVTTKGTFANKSRPENRSGTDEAPDPLDPSSYGPGAYYDSGTFGGNTGIMQAIHTNLENAGYSNSQIGQFAAQVLALHQ